MIPIVSPTQDRLAWLLDRFELRARVLQAGVMQRPVRFEAAHGVGYLHVLRAGKLQLATTGGRARRVDKPSLIFYLRATTHRLIPAGAAGADVVCAAVELAASLHNPLTQAVPRVVIVPLEQGGVLAEALGLLFREVSQAHCGRQAVIDRMSEVAVVLLLRHLMDEGLVRSGVLAGLADRRLMKAINAMHRAPAQTWSLKALASQAGMSRARFALHFRQTVGMTAGAYLAAWRISLAQSLLRQGKPVGAIAAQVGYESASALARAFRRRLRTSPRQWMKRTMQPPLAGGSSD